MATIYTLYKIRPKADDEDIFGITTYSGDSILRRPDQQLELFLIENIKEETGIDFDKIEWLTSSIERDQCLDYLDIAYGLK